MKRWMAIGVVGMLFIILFPLIISNKHSNQKVQLQPKEQLETENFIHQYLQTEDGMIRTNITDRKTSYLSESVGLWLQYLIDKNDYQQFDQQIAIVKKYFLTDDYLVAWKVEGTKKLHANAFIDDLRIVHALYTAGAQWSDRSYITLANKMGKNLVRYQVVDELLVDYVDLHSKEKGVTVTLSYLIPDGLEQMEKMKILPNKIYEKNKQLLLNAPHTSLGFFPKSYDITKKKYMYDQSINLIDQFYVGIHRAQWGGDIIPLYDFAKAAFKQGNGKLYGQYSRETGKPVVQYEAPSVYALAILMSFEVGDEEFAAQLYRRMKQLQQNDKDSPYYGGYIDVQTKDTHSFDNLLAMIAERRIIDEDVH